LSGRRWRVGVYTFSRETNAVIRRVVLLEFVFNIGEGEKGKHMV
jgi:hypothetical protein